MKKTLIALAVLASVAGVAQAQSAVTVYGKLDLGLQKESGSGKTTQLAGNHGSRLGFKGTEDLGGGLSAIFQIENRFDASTGTITNNGLNPLFEGQSIVGLAGAFGTVKLGRTYNIVDGVAATMADPFEGDGISGQANTVTAARLSNTVTYISPSMSGFSASAQAQLHETTVGKNGWGVAGAYANGPITAGIGYQKLTTTTAANQGNIWGLNGSYAFGPATVLLGYDVLDTKAVPAVAKTKTTILGATYAVGSGLVKAAYSQQKQNDTDRKFALGYQHNLSKRTSTYADIAHTNPGAAGVESFNGIQVGVTHNF